jgi:hypothetical protein
MDDSDDSDSEVDVTRNVDSDSDDKIPLNDRRPKVTRPPDDEDVDFDHD